MKILSCKFLSTPRILQTGAETPGARSFFPPTIQPSVQLNTIVISAGACQLTDFHLCEPLEKAWETLRKQENTRQKQCTRYNTRQSMTEIILELENERLKGREWNNKEGTKERKKKRVQAYWGRRQVPLYERGLVIKQSPEGDLRQSRNTMTLQRRPVTLETIETSAGVYSMMSSLRIGPKPSD